ncbi:hypothetical protein D3C76_1233030 [compost metagenome]
MGHQHQIAPGTFVRDDIVKQGAATFRQPLVDLWLLAKHVIRGLRRARGVAAQDVSLLHTQVLQASTHRYGGLTTHPGNAVYRPQAWVV